MEARQQDVRICDVPPQDIRISDAPPAVRVVEQTRRGWWMRADRDMRGGWWNRHGAGGGCAQTDMRGGWWNRRGAGGGCAQTETCAAGGGTESAVALEDSAVSSVPISPSRVRVESSQDIRDKGHVFEVSPDASGFLMRPSAAAGRAPVACFPFPQDLDSYSDPVLGDPVAFALSAPVPGSDNPPMTFPVYTLPSGLALLPGQSSVQTVMVSAVSSRPEGWSSGVPLTFDVSREGPFDAYSSPWILGISPLLSPAAPKARDGRYCNAPRPSVCPSVCLSVCPSIRPSITFSFRTVTQKRIYVFSQNFAGMCTMSWGCAV